MPRLVLTRAREGLKFVTEITEKLIAANHSSASLRQISDATQSVEERIRESREAGEAAFEVDLSTRGNPQVRTARHRQLSASLLEEGDGVIPWITTIAVYQLEVIQTMDKGAIEGVFKVGTQQLIDRFMKLYDQLDCKSIAAQEDPEFGMQFAALLALERLQTIRQEFEDFDVESIVEVAGSLYMLLLDSTLYGRNKYGGFHERSKGYDSDAESIRAELDGILANAPQKITEGYQALNDLMNEIVDLRMQIHQVSEIRPRTWRISDDGVVVGANFGGSTIRKGSRITPDIPNGPGDGPRGA